MFTIAAVSVISNVRQEGSIPDSASSDSIVAMTSGLVSDRPERLTSSVEATPGLACSATSATAADDPASISWISPKRSAM